MSPTPMTGSAKAQFRLENRFVIALEKNTMFPQGLEAVFQLPQVRDPPPVESSVTIGWTTVLGSVLGP